MALIWHFDINFLSWVMLKVDMTNKSLFSVLANESNVRTMNCGTKTNLWFSCLSLKHQTHFFPVAWLVVSSCREKLYSGTNLHLFTALQVKSKNNPSPQPCFYISPLEKIVFPTEIFFFLLKEQTGICLKIIIRNTQKKYSKSQFK